MAFGKRPAGFVPQPQAGMAAPQAPATVLTNEPEAASQPERMAVSAKAPTSTGGFVALLLAVIAVSAGGAFAAPSLFDWMQQAISGSAPVRPIADVVAGLDRERAKAALAKEAFPDRDGHAFMASLNQFPDERDRLLGQMAEAAMAGADRDALLQTMNTWSVRFAVDNLPAISRSGSKGFDTALAIAKDGLSVLQTSTESACTMGALQRLANDPMAATNLAGMGAYGAPGYGLTMRSGRALVDLAAAGRNAPDITPKLQPQDADAIQTVFTSMMRDPQATQAIQLAMTAGGGSSRSPSDLAASIDLCGLGKLLVVKLQNLPEGTKSRLWAMALNGKLGPDMLMAKR